MSEEELQKYLGIVNHYISKEGNLEEIKKYIARVLYDVDKNYKQEIKKLQSQLQQKENIIKEVREKIKLTESKEKFCIKYIQIDRKRYDSIIKLLDKGE